MLSRFRLPFFSGGSPPLFARKSFTPKGPRRSRRTQRPLRFQPLESRRMLAADAPLADITGLWVTVGEREYFTSEQASVSIDMAAGETLQVTGIRYGLDQSYSANDGVIAFESYVRREHGASQIGSYDYTDGRFADPLADPLVPGHDYVHSGNDAGWQLDVIDNRIAVIAIRYFEDQSVVEDRMFVDVNVTDPTLWTDSVTPVHGSWVASDNEIITDTSNDGTSLDVDADAGLSVIETGTVRSDRFEIGVKTKAVRDHAYANGFVVIDYRNDTDFDYAGLRLAEDRWVIGHYDGQFNDLAVLDQEIAVRQNYDLRVAVDGSHVALAADGILRVTHTFDHDLGNGRIGLANQFAYTHFTDFRFFDNATPAEQLRRATAAADEARTDLDRATDELERAHDEQTRAQTFAHEQDRRRDEAIESAEQTATQHHDAKLRLDHLRSQFQPWEIDRAQLDALHDAAAQRAESVSDRVQSQSDYVEQLSHSFQNESDKHDAAVLDYQRLSDAADKAIAHHELAVSDLKQWNQSAEQAERLADELENAPKAIRKEAEQAAKRARKDAERAEKATERAEDAAEDAIEKRDEAMEVMNSTESRRASLDTLFRDARDELDRLQSDLDHAHSELTQLQQRRDQIDRRIDLARREVSDLQDRLPHLQDEKVRTEEAARIAIEDAERAYRDAEHASDAALAAQEKMEHLAQVAQQADESVDEARRMVDRIQNHDATSDGTVAYALNFNQQDDGAFEHVSGEKDLAAGQMHLVADSDSWAINVLDDNALPSREQTRMYATIRADAHPNTSDQSSDHESNGFIVFDYQNESDFKYAGMRADQDEWVVGQVAQSQHSDVAVLDEVIGQGPAHELQVWIQDNVLTLLVEGETKLRHTFDAPIDDGQLGLANHDAHSRFDQVAVMPLFGGSGDAGLDQNTDAFDQAIAEMF